MGKLGAYTIVSRTNETITLSTGGHNSFSVPLDFLRTARRFISEDIDSKRLDKYEVVKQTSKWITLKEGIKTFIVPLSILKWVGESSREEFVALLKDVPVEEGNLTVFVNDYVFTVVSETATKLKLYDPEEDETFDLPKVAVESLDVNSGDLVLKEGFSIVEDSGVKFIKIVTEEITDEKSEDEKSEDEKSEDEKSEDEEDDSEGVKRGVPDGTGPYGRGAGPGGGRADGSGLKKKKKTEDEEDDEEEDEEDESVESDDSDSIVELSPDEIGEFLDNFASDFDIAILGYVYDEEESILALEFSEPPEDEEAFLAYLVPEVESFLGITIKKVVSSEEEDNHFHVDLHEVD